MVPLAEITGHLAAPYNDDKDSKCSYADEGGTTQTCKYLQSDLKTYQHEKLKKCWGSNNVNANIFAHQIDYLVDHFCMPDFTGDEIGEAIQSGSKWYITTTDF